MLLVNSLFHPVIAGILLAAVLAAVMSTADSQLLVSSSALAEDFYKQVLKPDASSEKVVAMGRIGVVAISVVAMFLAMTPDSSVLDSGFLRLGGFWGGVRSRRSAKFVLERHEPQRRVGGHSGRRYHHRRLQTPVGWLVRLV